jgi:hypothetical protein
MNQVLRVGLVMLLTSGSAGFAVPASADENTLLNYCLNNPKLCAISVESLDEGWQGHWNADRPQTLASLYKVLPLLGYAQAVAKGSMSPDDTVDKNEWGRYFAGGTTLSTSWDLLGQPDRVRLDDLARVMIVNSDNSAPDLFLDLLKKARIRKAVRLFDWHDVPVGGGSFRSLWQNLNDVAGTGDRVAADYGGFEASGYQRELARHAKALRNDAYVAAFRANLCDQPPWLPGSPGCSPPQPFTTEKSFRILRNKHYTRGTTRSYATLMRKLLDGSLLSPKAQEVVDRNLDKVWLDRSPQLRQSFSRFGLKGGGFGMRGGGQQIVTWANYMETSGGRFVAVVFLQDMRNPRKAPQVADFWDFAQQFALNAAFRQRVRDAIGGATLPTELAPKINGVKSQGRTVTLKAQVFNTSPVASGGPIKVSLFVLDDPKTAGATALKSMQIGPLAGYRSKRVTLRATSPQDISGKLAVLMIDSDEAIAEQDEKNNVTWERLK